MKKKPLTERQWEIINENPAHKKLIPQIITSDCDTTRREIEHRESQKNAPQLDNLKELSDDYLPIDRNSI